MDANKSIKLDVRAFGRVVQAERLRSAGQQLSELELAALREAEEHLSAMTGRQALQAFRNWHHSGVHVASLKPDSRVLSQHADQTPNKGRGRELLSANAGRITVR